MLRAFGYSGILNEVQGLLIGRARDYTLEEKKKLETIVLDVLKEFEISIPVVANMDFGHTDPQFILKYGQNVKINNKSVK